MKRLCAILLGLMMLAGLVCLRTENLSRTCSQNAGACHGHHSGAAHPFGGQVPVSSPDGTTPLTAAELDWFGRCSSTWSPAGPQPVSDLCL